MSDQTPAPKPPKETQTPGKDVTYHDWAMI
jgi:hypothetical protein